MLLTLSLVVVVLFRVFKFTRTYSGQLNCETRTKQHQIEENKNKPYKNIFAIRQEIHGVLHQPNNDYIDYI